MPSNVSKQDAPESGDNNFEETMLSAFWRGVSLLEESDSNSRQGQRSEAGPSNSLSSKEGFSGVPKNVTSLKPVIGQLMDKDPAKGFSPAQLESAKYNIDLLRRDQRKRAESLRDYIGELEDELVLANILTEENREK